MRVGKAVPLLTWTAIQSSRSPPSAFPPNIPTRLMPSCLQTHRSMALPRDRFSLPLRWAVVSALAGTASIHVAAMLATLRLFVIFLVAQDDRRSLAKPCPCRIEIDVLHGFPPMFFKALADVLAICAELGNKFLDHFCVRVHGKRFVELRAVSDKRIFKPIK